MTVPQKTSQDSGKGEGGTGFGCQQPPEKVDIRTYNESNELLTDRFCAYLADQKYDLGRVAFLSEEETAFGSLASVGRASRAGDQDK